MSNVQATKWKELNVCASVFFLYDCWQNKKVNKNRPRPLSKNGYKQKTHYQAKYYDKVFFNFFEILPTLIFLPIAYR